MNRYRIIRAMSIGFTLVLTGLTASLSRVSGLGGQSADSESPNGRYPLGKTVMKRSATALTGLAVLGGLLLLPGAPASASTAQCTTVKVIWDAFGQYQISVPATSSGSPYCWLAQGDFSSAVTALQTAIKTCMGPSYAYLNIDGDYGPQTKGAVTDVQNAARAAGDNISVDGVYGPQTKSVMGFPVIGQGPPCSSAP